MGAEAVFRCRARRLSLQANDATNSTLLFFLFLLEYYGLCSAGPITASGSAGEVFVCQFNSGLRM